MAGALGLIFDEDPQGYDRARPGYPPVLFDDLADLAGVGPGTRVVEVGPGTGQATRGLVELGAHVTAVEPGPGLAAVLRQRSDPARVDVRVSTFEAWEPQGEAFDAVTAFTAWHWPAPGVRAARAAAVLRPGGALATVTTSHVRGGSTAFFEQAQACYERWDPATPPGLRPEPAGAVPPDLDEVDASADWHPAVRRRYRWEITYSTAAYLDVLGTYSGHRALPAALREGLLACVGELADGYGGSVTKAYLHELRVARRR